MVLAFLTVCLPWPLAFILISREPARHCPLMPLAILEKLGYLIVMACLFATRRTPLVFARPIDGVGGVVPDCLAAHAAPAGARGSHRPLDGVNVWDVIADNKPSPRTEIVYNIEPFRGAVRQGDWKCIWRTMMPTSVDLYNLAEDPGETKNLAGANPNNVAAMQDRIDTLGKQCVKPLFLVYVGGVGLAHGKPVIAYEAGQPRAMIEGGAQAITDEG